MMSMMGDLVGDKEFLEKSPDNGGQITFIVIRASVDSASYEVLKSLLSRGSKVTEGIIITVLRILQSKHLFKSLLNMGSPAEVVTQEMMVQAVMSKYSKKETVELLQSRGGQVAAELIVIVARSISFSADVGNSRRRTCYKKDISKKPKLSQGLSGNPWYPWGSRYTTQPQGTAWYPSGPR